MVSLVGFDLAFAASAARGAVITFMNPSISRVHPHSGVREDLASLEKLSAFLSQQGQILLFRVMSNRDTMFLHIEPGAMQDAPCEAVDEVGELVADARPGLGVEVELAGGYGVRASDVVAETFPRRACHHVVQPLLDLALSKGFSIIWVDVSEIWRWRGPRAWWLLVWRGRYPLSTCGYARGEVTWLGARLVTRRETLALLLRAPGLVAWPSVTHRAPLPPIALFRAWFDSILSPANSRTKPSQHEDGLSGGTLAYHGAWMPNSRDRRISIPQNSIHL